MEYIVLDAVNHVYHKGEENEYTALENISFTVAQGEFIAILGINGSGKSTLAKHLNAILLPTGGSCKIAGMDTKDPDNLWNIRQEVGMVFQNPDNQIIAAVVEDDVAFGPENLGVPSKEIEKRVAEALEAVGMTEYRKFAPNLLSGGQKQRVAIAGALAMQTKCLVLDEPTAMLDPQGRREVLATVKRLNREMGITVIYIPHFMEEAAEADRVIVLDNGKLVENGKPEKVFSQVEKMKKYGLDVPLAAEVAWNLQKRGIKLSEDIISDEDLVSALCR